MVDGEAEESTFDHCERRDRECLFPGKCGCNCIRCQVQRGEESDVARAEREAYWNPILAKHQAAHRGRTLDFKCGCIPKEVEENWNRRNQESGN